MRCGPRECLWIGGSGATVAAACCFTPLLAFALASLGLGWVTAYLDWFLLPLLALCLALLGAGLWRLRARRRGSGTPL